MRNGFGDYIGEEEQLASEIYFEFVKNRDAHVVGVRDVVIYDPFSISFTIVENFYGENERRNVEYNAISDFNTFSKDCRRKDELLNTFFNYITEDAVANLEVF